MNEYGGCPKVRSCNELLNGIARSLIYTTGFRYSLFAWSRRTLYDTGSKVQNFHALKATKPAVINKLLLITSTRTRTAVGTSCDVQYCTYSTSIRHWKFLDVKARKRKGRIQGLNALPNDTVSSPNAISNSTTTASARAILSFHTNLSHDLISPEHPFWSTRAHRCRGSSDVIALGVFRVPEPLQLRHRAASNVSVLWTHAVPWLHRPHEHQTMPLLPCSLHLGRGVSCSKLHDS